MSTDTALVQSLFRETFSDPPGAARRILSLNVPTDTLWQALLLVAVLSALAAQVPARFLLPPDAVELSPILMASPFVLVVIQGALLTIMVFATHWTGRAFGGMGSFEGALALVTWLQFVLVALQILQSVLGIVAPIAAGLVLLASVVAFFWLLTQFVMVLHGFRSGGVVFIGIIGSMLGLVFVLAMLLTILGFTPIMELPSNV